MDEKLFERRRMKLKIILIYGGKSADHDVSILSAYSMLQAVYFEYYQVELVYISKTGEWRRGAILTAPPKNQVELELTDENSQVIDCAQIRSEDSVIFPLLHGPNGEDGKIQGLFETLEMLYVGAGVLASACGMDKIITKHILQQIGIPQVPYVSVMKSVWKVTPEESIEKCEGSLVYPMFVKPANMGSSVGISKVTTKEELIVAIEAAFCYDRRVVGFFRK